MSEIDPTQLVQYLDAKFAEIHCAFQSQTSVQQLQHENQLLRQELEKRDGIIADLRARLAEMTAPKNVFTFSNAGNSATSSSSSSAVQFGQQAPKFSFGGAGSGDNSISTNSSLKPLVFGNPEQTPQTFSFQPTPAFGKDTTPKFVFGANKSDSLRSAF